MRLRTGKIEIDGIVETYKVYRRLGSWAEIQIIRNDLVISMHSIPWGVSENLPFRTGGCRYKLIETAETASRWN